MIFKITQSQVWQRCAMCDAEHTINLADLVAGNEYDPNIINMPSCSCGAMEFLNRTWDHDETEGIWCEQRCRVNRLHSMLVAANQIHSNQAATIAQEILDNRVPQDIAVAPEEE